MNSHNSSSNEVSEMGNSNLPSPSGGSVGSSTCSALRTVQLKLPNTPTLSGPPSLNEASIAYQKFAVVVASVGDSQAFLLSKTHGIRELTGPVPQGLSSLVGLGGENKNISSGTTTSLSQSLELSESMIINKEIELNKLGLTQMPFDPQDAKSSQIGLAQEETPGYVFNTPEEQKEEKPRNFRDTGGALGPVHSNDDPELHNLMCAGKFPPLVIFT
ncbi:unnamed protein product [Protopolystoma xenopodis]|uniref:PPM-type phosphatase domain-containing protein n=1 Tax=Protopolystoma xenopodis TaxID=117903 RepID=A0A448WUA6_9PLAT|nr:unnamed protein product [Protopolystoma xenopodis]